jgi:N utilization substance protein B
MADRKQSPKIFHRRHVARKLATQAIYQWQIGGQSADDIVTQFQDDIDYHKSDPDFFAELTRETILQCSALDELLKVHLDRDIERVDPIERAILRLSVYELKSHLEIPYRVVLNEAISLAKKFGAQDTYKYVNAVLDKVLPQIRKIELSSEKICR